MSAHQINLQQKFSIEAKAAFDRLLTQTLWETHPVSFYHSATQELVYLVKYYLRKNNEWSDGDYIWLEWNYGNSKKIEYVEGESSVTYEICKYSVGGSEKWDIVIKSKELSKGKDIHKDICEPFLKNFITDIHCLITKSPGNATGDFPSKSAYLGLGYSNPRQVIRHLTTSVDQLFESLTGEKIESRIMLYCAKEPTKFNKGFLFYVDYEIPDVGEEIKDIESLYEVLKGEFVKKTEDPNSTTKYVNILRPIRIYLDGKKTCISLDNKRINFIKTELLTHPDTFLTKHLLYETLCCATPLCNQPIGSGIAGRVAKSGITFVSQFLGKEKDLDIKTIIDSEELAYALMRMIEQGLGINPSRRGIASPLYGKGQLIGVLYASKEITNNNFFHPTQVEIFESIAHKAGNILQEMRDYEYFESLIRVKANEGVSDELSTINKIVEEMKNKLRLVMNVYNITSGENGLRNEKTDKKLKLELLPDGELQISLPAVNQRKIFTITANFDDGHADIFELHKEKLELFFNYCWGLTGYITPLLSPVASATISVDVRE